MFCQFEDDFPKLHILDGELDAWERFWFNYKESPPNTVLATLRTISTFAESFPNIFIALKLLVTLLITSCECERSFSAMKKLKNYYRSTGRRKTRWNCFNVHLHCFLKSLNLRHYKVY